MELIKNKEQTKGNMKEIMQLKYELEILQQEIEKSNCEKKEMTDKLENLTKEMNQFTYIVSHDLQAPLRTITGFLELLEKRYSDKLDDSARQFIDFAKNGTVKMKNLVLDLLEYSRLSSVSQEHVHVDLNETICEVIENNQETIKETAAIIVVDHLPLVKADKTQIVKLFQQLLENALKFRGAAVPQINISAKKEVGFWEIAVADNGIGIEPAYFEKIFIIFRRLYADETRYARSGTGLAFCKKIVELHGGTIRVESEVNKGSTFIFTLPAKT